MAARPTNSDEVFLAIRSSMAPKIKVVHFNCGHGAAKLTSPSVPLQNAPMQSLIINPIQALATIPFLRQAATPKLSRNSCCCGCGNSRKSRRADTTKVAGVTSAPAPARKSAQIISRQ
jgi:hypothetical protein